MSQSNKYLCAFLKQKGYRVRNGNSSLQLPFYSTSFKFQIETETDVEKIRQAITKNMTLNLAKKPKL